MKTLSLSLAFAALTFAQAPAAKDVTTSTPVPVKKHAGKHKKSTDSAAKQAVTPAAPATK